MKKMPAWEKEEVVEAMDKATIIRLKKGGMPTRKVARELGLDRKTVSRYWAEHLRLRSQLEDGSGNGGNSKAAIRATQEAITAKPGYNSSGRGARKYTSEMAGPWTSCSPLRRRSPACLGQRISRNLQ
jgi:hypothetical protein